LRVALRTQYVSHGSHRLFALMQIVPGHGLHLRGPEPAFGTAHKVELIQRLRQDDKEGVVFRKLTER